VVWADARQFAAMFAGARVYVFACSTLAETETETPGSFGREAVALGVAAYAGHHKPVHAPGDVGLHDRQMQRAIERVVRTFLAGCDDAGQLRMEARRALSRGARAPLKVTSATMNDARLRLDWSLDWERILGSLRVELPRA
jgi:hypothetical protein